MGTPANIIPIMGKLSLDPITVAWLAQLATSFGSNPSPSFVSALDTMIVGMRTDGNILLLDRFWIFAQEVQGYSRVSIVNPSSTQITEIGTPTWTTNQGYTGDGSTMYLKTGFVPSTNGVNFILNSASIGMYSRTDVNGNYIDMGAITATATNASFIYARVTDVMFGDLNKTVASSSVANTDSRGLFAANRTASNAEQKYRNGTNLASATTASAAVTNFELYVMGFNLGGTASNLSTRQYSMAFAGGGGINHANFYSRFQTFATTIGFNV